MLNFLMRASGAAAATVLLFVLFSIVWPGPALSMDQHTWSEQEKAVLRSLSIESLGSLPVDPSNRYSDNPQAAAFGKKLCPFPMAWILHREDPCLSLV
jgi:cytochrome c peroxidase